MPLSDPARAMAEAALERVAVRAGAFHSSRNAVEMALAQVPEGVAGRVASGFDQLIVEIAGIFERVTGRRPAFTTDLVTGARTGWFISVMTVIAEQLPSDLPRPSAVGEAVVRALRPSG